MECAGGWRDGGQESAWGGNEAEQRSNTIDPEADRGEWAPANPMESGLRCEA